MTEARHGARSGVVLVGGRSSRLGTPKALVDLGGAPLVRHVLHAVAPACHDLLLVAAPREAQPEDLRAGLAEEVERLANDAGRSARVVHDAHAHLGPVSGLATALGAARGELAWVTACDVPFLATGLVDALFALAEGEATLDVVVPRWRGYLEPLLAVYRVRTMAPHFARQLADGVLRPTDRLAECRVRVVEEDEILRLDPAGRSFVNVNAPDDLDTARALIAREPSAITLRASRPVRSRRGSTADG
ncbi:molybdenum cofactor guanylyltransferase [Candidatus Binatia bacterium]|nr:molybdenum cofactor guanylyltransferase [Candidatus Binatia bacterium]